MEFFEEYKSLEEICSDCLRDKRGVTAYIEEMEKRRDGLVYVPNWANDLKRLQEYRRIRNRIAHEKGCYEEDLCNEDDVRWLEEFHDRILYQEDPLAVYRKEFALRARHRAEKANSDVATAKPAENVVQTRSATQKRKFRIGEIFLRVCLLILLIMLAFVCYQIVSGICGLQ